MKQSETKMNKILVEIPKAEKKKQQYISRKLREINLQMVKCWCSEPVNGDIFRYLRFNNCKKSTSTMFGFLEANIIK